MIRMDAQKGTLHVPGCVGPPNPPVEFPLFSSGIASTTGNMDIRTKKTTTIIDDKRSQDPGKEGGDVISNDISEFFLNNPGSDWAR
jgi:hypothetical protein